MLGAFPNGEPDDVGSWLLVHNGEALLLEIPEGLTVRDVACALREWAQCSGMSRRRTSTKITWTSRCGTHWFKLFLTHNSFTRQLSKGICCSTWR